MVFMAVFNKSFSTPPPPSTSSFSTSSSSSTTIPNNNNNNNNNHKSRPLPLKQRTSSTDTRRDYTVHTWKSLLVLIKLREYFVTVDNFSIWRRHLAWAIQDGKYLRDYMTQRYASNMVFMSLLLSTELSVLFNSAEITTTVRFELGRGNHTTISFWVGFMVILSALLTLLSLISTFTAWAMVNAVDESNAHAIFRSSIGQYAAELPGRFIVCSIYSFLISFLLFFFILLPVGIWPILLLMTTVLLFVHIVSSFSSFGRVIMHTGAMGKSRIFDKEYETSLLPHSLHAHLFNKAKANLSQRTSITRQYRRTQRPLDRYFSEDELIDQLQNGVGLNHRGGRDEDDDTTNHHHNHHVPHRRRVDSLVRFADEELGELDTIFSSTTLPTTPTTPLSNYGSTTSSIEDFHSYQSHQRTLTPISDISQQDEDDDNNNTTPIAVRRKDLVNRPPTPVFQNQSSSSGRFTPPLSNLSTTATSIVNTSNNNINNDRTPRSASSTDDASSSMTDLRPQGVSRPNRPPLPTSSAQRTSNSSFSSLPFGSGGSTSSLEQWLQASPALSVTKSTAAFKKGGGGESRDVSFSSSSSLNNTTLPSTLPPPPPSLQTPRGSSLGNDPSRLTQPPPPPPPASPLPPREVTTFRTNSITSSLGEGREGSSTFDNNNNNNNELKSILNGVLSDHEEERFAMDYGDITDDEPGIIYDDDKNDNEVDEADGQHQQEQQPNMMYHRRPPRQLRISTSDHQQGNTNDNNYYCFDSDEVQDSERTSLLDHTDTNSRSRNNYSTTPSPTTTTASMTVVPHPPPVSSWRRSLPGTPINNSRHNLTPTNTNTTTTSNNEGHHETTIATVSPPALSPEKSK